VRAGNGQRELSVREPNRNAGRRLGGLQQVVETSWGAWGSAARQAEVRENLDGHGGIVDRRENGQRPAALRTGGEIDGEDTFE